MSALDTRENYHVTNTHHLLILKRIPNRFALHFEQTWCDLFSDKVDGAPHSDSKRHHDDDDKLEQKFHSDVVSSKQTVADFELRYF